MKLVEVGGKVTARPYRGIGAIESQRIAIMTVDIDGSFSRTGDIVCGGRGIIADQRNNDASIASLVLDVLHIVGIGEAVVSTASTSVLVLRLI
jgi:hypothetical protein